MNVTYQQLEFGAPAPRRRTTLIHDGETADRRDAKRITVHLFDGETFNPYLDAKRLSTQYETVMGLMSDGNWRTLQEICDATGIQSQASVSARLRDARKARFGSHRVRRARDGNVFRYKVET